MSKRDFFLQIKLGKNSFKDSEAELKLVYYWLVTENNPSERESGKSAIQPIISNAILVGSTKS